MKNRLRETWNAGKPALNGWLGIPSTFSAEIMSKQDFDSITIDLQHGLTDYSIAVPMMQAMSAGDATMLCRVPWLLISERMRESARNLGHNATVLIARNASDKGLRQTICEWADQR